MKDKLVKIFGVNWTTNLPATGFALCASTELMGLLPEEWKQIAIAFCVFMVSAGLFAAKSANVSNSPTPAAPSIVSPANHDTPNPSAEVKP